MTVISFIYVGILSRFPLFYLFFILVALVLHKNAFNTILK